MDQIRKPGSSPAQTQQSASAGVGQTQPFCLTQASAAYLEVVLESVTAAVFIVFTAGEVEAKFAGDIGAVGHELGAERVVHVSTGIPHDAGAWCEGNVMKPIKGRIKEATDTSADGTCGNGNAQVHESSDEYG